MRLLGLVVAMVATAAIAEVGKVSALEGSATRAAKGGAAKALAVGTPIELGDTIEVKAGNVKLELTDGSVVLLSEKSRLVINEAQFEGQERKGFKALLQSGSLWTRVKKALGGGAFEVSTERAVAGVRGTVFRIDAETLVKAAAKGGQARKASIVRVVEGVVNVRPTDAVVKASAAVAAKRVAAPKGPRVEVPGPAEISADEWEKRFADLQQNQQVVVGIDLWEQAEIDATAKADAFSKWIEKSGQ